MITVEQSYAHCEAIARHRARNFYYAFLLLPRPKRLAMCAVYAFMRRCDDLSDGEDASPEALHQWRNHLDLVLQGHSAPDPLWPAFAHTAQRFQIPHRLFHEMIDGVASDFSRSQIDSFDDLYRYCYLVASVVGLTIIHIFEFSDPRAGLLAEKCGIAFQLTNILRDVREDFENQRVYLPADELRHFGVHRLDQPSPELRELLRFQGRRARQYYDDARPLLHLVHHDSRPALWALMEIYRRLLHRIEQSDYDVLSHRVRLSTLEKVWILAQARFRA
ncbi:MAG: phytoene/squalene synthase family protein [Bryobacteraceae bacterium]|nr:phytoene/squalene synthase family protein [Solibacteraceae bacterium]MCO5353988.1 phytoene/squalene synthase family protein [Bryobacteraceae bacterium]